MTRFFAGICGVDKAGMKFKNKIIISFCIIIFIPILLAVAVLFGFQKIQLKSIEQTYGVESDDYSYFSNSMQLLSRFTRESFETLLEAGLHRTGMGRGEVFYFASCHAEIPGGRPGKEVTLCLKWKTVGN